MDDLTWEILQPRDYWNILFTVLTTCHDELCHVFDYCGCRHVTCHDGTSFSIIVIRGWLDGSAILGPNIELLNVVIQVLHKLVLWYVRWGVY